MEQGELQASSDTRLRRAHTEARWESRRYRREFGVCDTALSLIHDLRMAAWLVEKMRVEGGAMSERRLEAMQAQLLRKLARAELTTVSLLGDPFQASKGNN